MSMAERAALLTSTAGLTGAAANDVETVLEAIPTLTADITCNTEGENEIQEGDLVTITAWINLRRRNSRNFLLPHCPYYPFPKEESFWLLLGDSASNSVWFSQKLTFGDEVTAAAATSATVQEVAESQGKSGKEISSSVKEAVKKVKNGSRLVIGKFLAPSKGIYNLSFFCLCDTWIGCDWRSDLTLKVSKQPRAGSKNVKAEIVEDEDEDSEDNAGSEYSDEEEQVKSKK